MDRMKTRLPYALFGVLATLVGVALGHLVAAPAPAPNLIRQAGAQGSGCGSSSGFLDCS